MVSLTISDIFVSKNRNCEQTIIRNIIIRESQQQPKPNRLIQLDSEQICRELGDFLDHNRSNKK